MQKAFRNLPRLCSENSTTKTRRGIMDWVAPIDIVTLAWSQALASGVLCVPMRIVKNRLVFDSDKSFEKIDTCCNGSPTHYIIWANENRDETQLVYQLD